MMPYRKSARNFHLRCRWFLESKRRPWHCQGAGSQWSCGWGPTLCSAEAASHQFQRMNVSFVFLKIRKESNTWFWRRHLTCLALFPKTNSIASITLLLPLPFGPTTEEKLWKKERRFFSFVHVLREKVRGVYCVSAYLVKRSHPLYTGIWLEVLQNHLRNH